MKTEGDRSDELWEEFGEYNRQERIREFAEEYRAKDVAWWRGLKKAKSWPSYCPKCGLGELRHTPRLELVRGGNLSIGISRYCGVVTLNAEWDYRAPRFYSEALSNMIPPRHEVGMFDKLEIITVTCDCGHVMGPYRPNDAED